ncbi:hypothetical protein [Komagataeibacter xylinus]|uniref:hypothetical protein n=1 Tax=Komagataeibacter xylinus TaxID=28448 RepID=UPI001F0D8D39|nr:hypothetical protein [Komagataeibacter xylinus]
MLLSTELAAAFDDAAATGRAAVLLMVWPVTSPFCGVIFLLPAACVVVAAIQFVEKTVTNTAVLIHSFLSIGDDFCRIKQYSMGRQEIAQLRREMTESVSGLLKTRGNYGGRNIYEERILPTRHEYFMSVFHRLVSNK